MNHADVSKAILETIGGAGYIVVTGADNGQHVVEAIDQKTGERFIVRGPKLYEATMELAEQVGIGRAGEVLDDDGNITDDGLRQLMMGTINRQIEIIRALKAAG